MGGAPVTPPDHAVEAYLELSPQQIERLVLCLLVEEALRARLDELPEHVRDHARRALQSPSTCDRSQSSAAKNSSSDGTT